MAVEHFSHDHLLVLKGVIEKADEEILCYGCQKPIMAGSSAYTCCNTDNDGCQDFFLHKNCAELPKEIKHPMHMKHTLTLLANPSDSEETYICDVCQSNSTPFIYYCFLCDFGIEVNCAFEERSFSHEAHDHEFTLVRQPASFHCHACDSEARDLSYRCTVCPFWMHKSCASSPQTIYLSIHHHPLTLSYFMPEIYRTFKQICRICDNQLFSPYWLYMCGGCRFFVHIKCATSTTMSSSTEPMRDGKSENEVDDLNPNLIKFPAPDESSVDLIVHQFVKGISRAPAIFNMFKARNKITHWSHEEHPLILLDHHQLHQNKDHNEMKGTDKFLICNGCVNHISSEDPYYACPECNFTLHKFCTELPSKIKHLFHPQHPLELYNFPEHFIYGICDSCGDCSNGFFYACGPCKFWLDLGCAALPTTIIHEAHDHPLIQNKLQAENDDFFCKACQYAFHNMEYRCEACDFHVHKECATRFPGTIRHKWDDHPIPLVYGQIQDHLEVFYCEICEEEINPYFWLYFCRECDQSFHPLCLYPFDVYGNIKFGSKHKFDSHPHKLTFVHSTGEFIRYPHSLTLIPKSANNKCPPLCSSCGEAQIEVPVLECAPCKFFLCTTCAHSSIGAL